MSNLVSSHIFSTYIVCCITKVSYRSCQDSRMVVRAEVDVSTRVGSLSIHRSSYLEDMVVQILNLAILANSIK